MARLTVELAKKELEGLIEWGDTSIKDFKKKFDENPGNALDWSMDLFSKVALKQESEYILEAIKTGENNIDHICDYLTKEVISRARFPRHSTSITGNLWEESKLCAKAHILNRLNGGL